jgi:hypothetical protein
LSTRLEIAFNMERWVREHPIVGPSLHGAPELTGRRGTS